MNYRKIAFRCLIILGASAFQTSVAMEPTHTRDPFKEVSTYQLTIKNNTGHAIKIFMDQDSLLAEMANLSLTKQFPSESRGTELKTIPSVGKPAIISPLDERGKKLYRNKFTDRINITDINDKLLGYIIIGVAKDFNPPYADEKAGHIVLFDANGKVLSNDYSVRFIKFDSNNQALIEAKAVLGKNLSNGKVSIQYDYTGEVGE